MNLSMIKNIDFGKIEAVFVDAVVDQAESLKIEPTQVALRIFPDKLQNVEGYGIKVRISDLTGQNEEEIVPLKKLTFYDAGNHISQAFLKIFEAEVLEHNTHLDENINSVTTESYPNKIDLDKLEMFVQVNGNKDLDMNVVYDYNKLRKYSIREEFADAEDHLNEMKGE